MPLGQGWLNAWVKVNAKHNVISATAPQPSSGSKADEQQTSDSVQRPRSSSLSGESTSKQAMKRFNSRKQKRRSQAAASASADRTPSRLREKMGTLKEKQSDQSVANSHDSSAKIGNRSLQGSQEAGPSESGTAAGTGSQKPSAKEVASSELPSNDLSQEKVAGQQQHHVVEKPYTPPAHDTEGDNASLRFKSGFFGADIERYSSGHGGDLDRSGRISFVPHSDIKAEAASIASRGGRSAPPRAQTASMARSSNSARHLNRPNRIVPLPQPAPPSGGIGISFPFVGNNNNNSNNVPGPCKSCAQLEADLVAAREDVEYLRALSLRNETVCQSCAAAKDAAAANPDENDPHSTSTSIHALSSVSDSSRRINEVADRQRYLMEQETKEKARFQQDTHMKLQKYASLCKELDEEAATRNEEAITLHHDLDTVTSERNSMALKIKELQKKLNQLEQNNAEEQRRNLETLQLTEKESLSEATKAIELRDAIIADLTERLEKTISTMELERDQQRQRRQIIFPPRPSNGDSRSLEEVEEELRLARDALKSAESALENVQVKHKKKEIEWQMKMEALQRKLNDRKG